MKKIFRFSAIVAMLSMMATATVATSCSDDDDEENPFAALKDSTFTIYMGGSDCTTAGSFLSIKNCAAYKTADLATYAKDVEIVFNGSNFISADKSVNDLVKGNGNTATIESKTSKMWTFTTSTGFTGSITLADEPGSASTAYEVTVIRNVKN